MRVLIMSLIACCASIAQAEQYWVSYDADDGRFPEECGWTRHMHGGGAVRSIADGILTLDSMSDSMICDYYEIDRPTTPGPGEMFVAEWRVCVAQQSGFRESLGSIVADSGLCVAFGYELDHVVSWAEGWSVPIAPGLYHTYRLESTDLATYSFSIDDSHVRDGQFSWPGPAIPSVIFGDAGYGTTPTISLTQWEYFRFGIVPEPASATMVLALLMCARVAHRSLR